MKNDAFNVEKKTSVLFVSVSFIVLMLISLAWLVFYYIQRFRYIHAKDRLERKLCSQAKRALAIISTSVLKKDDLVRGRPFINDVIRKGERVSNDVLPGLLYKDVVIPKGGRKLRCTIFGFNV